MRSESLRYQLLKRLLWPLIPILIIGAVIAYLFALQAATNAEDLGLLDDALDLAKQIQTHQGKIELELPLAAQQMLLANNDDQVRYAAWSDANQLLAGDHRLITVTLPLSEENHRFQNITLDSQQHRVVVLRHVAEEKTVFIAVAQTMHGRNRLSNQAFFGILIPEALLALVSITVILFGVKRGLSPVEWLRNEIVSRSPHDLRPIEEMPAPEELRPVVHGINELLTELALSFADHRRFIADAAHQLRTPLAALSSQIEVHLEQPPQDASVMLRQLLTTTQRTSHLVNQLLSLAKLEHTEQTVCTKLPLNLQDVVCDATADYVVMADRKHIILNFALQPCQIIGNAVLLRELISNLLDNALRHSPEGGLVNVSLCKDGVHCLLTVEDNGAGVPEGDLGKLGFPFYRGTSTDDKGCGLGLAIVKEIASLHDATVSFDNVSNRSGFRVSVRFNVEQMHR